MVGVFGAIVALLSVIFNSFLFIVLIRNHRHRSSHLIYLTFLALADTFLSGKFTNFFSFMDSIWLFLNVGSRSRLYLFSLLFFLHDGLQGVICCFPLFKNPSKSLDSLHFQQPTSFSSVLICTWTILNRNYWLMPGGRESKIFKFIKKRHFPGTWERR